MKSKAGIVCMALGAALLLGALLLSRTNLQENTAAQQAVAEVMPQLVQQIKEKTATENTVSVDETLPSWELGLPVVPQQPGGQQSSVELQIPVELLTEEDKEMTEIEVLDERYIGFLSIPAIDLELPVMSTWSYEKLNIAPCRYTGSVRGEDLVVMAHNYDCFFGSLPLLEIGDALSFTDADGITTRYEVVGKDLLSPTAVEEMTSGDFDLTLFTCTYGGGSRVTIYCERVK